MKITEKYIANPVPVWVCAGENGCQAENDMDKESCHSCNKEHEKRYWNHNRVEIFRNNEDGSKEKIGQYTRTYSGFYHTFHPFVQGNKEYALISHEYTGTCVISLPSCEHVCGECEWKAFGFCPTGFYVPDKVDGQLGFVCGCVWGDDSGGWKLQFLDLSKLSEGKFTNEARFGYLELPPDISGNELHKVIEVDPEFDGEFYIEIHKNTRHSVVLGKNSDRKTIESIIHETAKHIFECKNDSEIFTEAAITSWLYTMFNEYRDL